MAPKSTPTLDKDAFSRRMKRIYAGWKSAKATEGSVNFSTVDALVVGLVKEEDVMYKKSAAFHLWLFGYELADTILVLCEDSIHMVASQKKIDFLKPLQGDENQAGVPPVKLYVRGKSDGGKEHFPGLIQAIKNSRQGKTIGIFAKEKLDGDAYTDWNNAITKAGFTKQDISMVVAYIMAPKDDKEIALMTKSSVCTVDLFKKFYWEQIMTAVDQDKRVKHLKIADGMDSAIKRREIIPNVSDPDDVEMCYPAIVQSGGKFNFKFNVTSENDNLQFGVICASFGVKYKEYCSNVARTVMVAPTKSQLACYDIAYELEEHIVKKLTAGARLCDVYEAGIAWLREKKPDLLENVKKNFGFATGLEFREAFLVINEKTTHMARKGMVFCVEVAFQGLKNPEGKTDAEKTFGIWLGDTVIVKETGPAEILTKGAQKKSKQVSIIVETAKDDDDKEDLAIIEVETATAGPAGRSRRTAVTGERLRTDFSGEEKRKKNQERLRDELNKKAYARLSKGKEEVAGPRLKKANVAYRNINNFPTDDEVKHLQIYVDKRAETLILPLFGEPVPFHISIIKSVAQSVEGDYTYLRINFLHPGAPVMGGQEKHVFSHPEAQFLKELTFRSSNTKEPGELAPASSNLTNTFRLVKELQKKYKTREQEEREHEGVIKQDTLMLNPNKNQPRLKDLFIRPPLSQKRISGALEAHVNGFRYTTLRGEKVDVLYNNIKHAFFQPCDGEMIILLHFHLKNAVVYQKRKIVDIQFYTEVGETTTDLGKHYHMHDRDDLASEQAERELRNRLTTAFKTFTEKVEAISKGDVDFDTPFRDLGFPGVPFRSTAILQPTSTCLVNLSEWPPFVITLDEVELVHFERVQFHIKNFDMVFVFKDYHRKPVLVTAIPMNLLEHVKSWLDNSDIYFTEGIQSLNWVKIMKTVGEDPKEFLREGGWQFLEPEDNATAAAEEDEEDDDEYKGSESEDAGSGSGSDSDDDSGDSEVDEEEEDDDASNEDLSSGEESGKDWDELEAEAAKADRQKAMEEEQESSRMPAKRPNQRFGGSGGGAKRMRR
ncbi:FACT complex subunit spt16 [Hypsibius exemplaris]|uniref:FACT complex subunit n=1 Tax=Hypsibius exemplaris TaxID=2072580 RepID=A0A1W0X2J8_HYPEX|nr:FACT complex subunit spt16 [Hypsibius exemplaris]